MIRAGQMLIAKALLLRHLSKLENLKSRMILKGIPYLSSHFVCLVLQVQTGTGTKSVAIHFTYK